MRLDVRVGIDENDVDMLLLGGGCFFGAFLPLGMSVFPLGIDLLSTLVPSVTSISGRRWLWLTVMLYLTSIVTVVALSV